MTGSNGVTDKRWVMPPRYRGLVPLDTNQTYTFTIESVQSGLKGYVFPEVIRIELNGLTVFDHEICEVHQRRMERKRVPIRYGLFISDSTWPSADTERTRFPHYREFVPGGCVRGPRSPKSERLFVCDECKASHSQWKAENLKK